jgi:hypothetical protein
MAEDQTLSDGTKKVVLKLCGWRNDKNLLRQEAEHINIKIVMNATG